MKKLVITLGAFFAFTALAAAQEQTDSMQRMPPAVTVTQIEQDARLAELERKKHESERKAVKEEKEQKEEDKRVTSNSINTSSTKKTSTRPGKQ